MLNKNLDIANIKRIYSEKKRISIDNFLEPEIAEFVYQGLVELCDKNLWYQVNYGNPQLPRKDLDLLNYILESFSYKYERYPLKGITLESMLQNDSRRKNLPDFKKFNQNPELELKESHPLRKIADMIDSKAFHNFITEITDHKLTYFKSNIAATRFSQDDYLSIHDDGSLKNINSRRVAFILNMSKNWIVHWGGNLVILDEKFENIIESYLPKFNNLILFDVPLPHSVISISKYSQSERFALSGWFNSLNSFDTDIHNIINYK